MNSLKKKTKKKTKKKNKKKKKRKTAEKARPRLFFMLNSEGNPRDKKTRYSKFVSVFSSA